MYLDCIEEDIMMIDVKGKNVSNLSRGEQKALLDLKNDTSIVIKEADKGSAVVVWDYEDYCVEADSQLSDKEVYQVIDTDPVSVLNGKIKLCIDKVKSRGDISQKVLDFFEVENPKLGRFYLLPKIHKRLENVPGRPVISNSSYYTEKISLFLDYHLQPLAQKVKSYIKDTNDFIKKLKNLPDLPEQAILCSIDVVALYPNIPHDFGLEALKEVLEKREDKTISTDTFLDLAELVLSSNYFEHNGKTYIQNRGTAIGTRFAPPYAILALAKFEEDAINNYTLKPWVWWRYIDDIFMIWEHGDQSLKEFINYLNNIHPTLKFTYKSSSSRTEFLDVDVIRKDNGLETDLFVKETDTHQYLHSTSCHTFHTKSGIPYGQALRIRRIVSEEASFTKRCQDLESWLLKRGYEKEMVVQEIDKAKAKDRDEILNINNKPCFRDSRLNLVLRYHPALSKNVHAILKKHQTLLQLNEEHKKVFDEIPRVTYRRCRNLKDSLVRATLPRKVPDSAGSKCCGKTKCKVGGNLLDTTTFSNTFKNPKAPKFDIREGPLTCDTGNIVYLMQCKICNIPYIGSSKPAFRFRFNNYKSQNRKFMQTGSVTSQIEFHSHFNQPGHNSFLEDATFTIIDAAPNNEQTLKKESFWQYKLDTFEPKGLNIRDVPIY